MPYGGVWPYVLTASAPPKVGHPKRDRAKVKAGRKAARRNR
jgi:hypothetical protein